MQPTPDEENGVREPAAGLDADVLQNPPVEASVVDVAEQHMPADPTDEVDGGLDTASVAGRGLEVGEWDAAEQTRTASQEDDYR